MTKTILKDACVNFINKRAKRCSLPPKNIKTKKQRTGNFGQRFNSEASLKLAQGNHLF